jgi:hypothetical protein
MRIGEGSVPRTEHPISDAFGEMIIKKIDWKKGETNAD